MLGRFLPIWAVIIIEFCLAYTLEVTLGGPLSFKLATKIFDPRTIHPMIFETTIICTTVLVMCQTMSFIAAWLYFPYYMGFNLATLLANFIKLVCFNFPFAFFHRYSLFNQLYVNYLDYCLKKTLSPVK